MRTINHGHLSGTEGTDLSVQSAEIRHLNNRGGMMREYDARRGVRLGFAVADKRRPTERRSVKCSRTKQRQR